MSPNQEIFFLFLLNTKKMNTTNVRLCAIFLLFFNLLKAQKEANVWHFGYHAALNFSTSPPSIATGSLETFEGSASISDLSGNLLFYTDGMTVYDKNHNIMGNGSGLFGHGSSTQSGIIVKKPGSNSVYYIFTQDATGGPNGLSYSIVDMTLAAGIGSVTTKNFLIHAPSCEKVTSVKHCNGSDAWIISHDFGTDSFRTYLLTSTGLNLAPVMSSAGYSIVTTNHTLGQLKVSPDGRKLGVAVWDPFIPAYFEIYDFDPSSGIVSNAINLGSFLAPYGCEFSQDGTKFYGGTYSNASIYQWDLCAGTPTAVIASMLTFSTSGSPIGSFQLAPDGKIYIARLSVSFLSVIHSPNSLGVACNFVDSSQSVAPNLSMSGLPNFINGYFKSKLLPFTYTMNCLNGEFVAPPALNSTVIGCSQPSHSINSHTWDFGDPGSGANNTSTLFNPSHLFSAIGTYTVKIKLQYQCSVDSIVIPVFTGNCVGVDEILSENSSVFPNPFSDYLKITAKEPAATEIYNSQGELVFYRNVSKAETTIDSSNWPHGLYVLILRSQNGTKKYLRVVKDVQ